MQGRTTQEEGGRKPAGSKVVLAAFLPAVAWLAGLQSVMAGIGEWTSSGPGGGTVQALAIDPRNAATLYAGGVGSGVFKSADGGRSWSAVNDGLTNLTILDLAIDPSTTPSTVYAATGGSGVFRSTDGGESWSQIGPPVPGPNAYVVAVDPVVPTTLYACIRAWLMKSTDAGMSWTTGSTGAENVSDLAIDAANPSTIYAAGAMATPTGGGLYKTLDGGATWRKVTWGLFDASGRDYDVSRVAIDPSSTSIVYITTAGG